MFALIETKGATHIAIHIPHAGAEKTLPAIASMLECSAIFIRNNYSSMETVKPEMSIILGNTYTSENSENEIIVAQSGAVIGEDFVPAAPDVFVSNAKGLKKANDENSRLRTENSFIKSELERVKAEMAEVLAANASA